MIRIVCPFCHIPLAANQLETATYDGQPCLESHDSFDDSVGDSFFIFAPYDFIINHIGVPFKRCPISEGLTMGVKP